MPKIPIPQIPHHQQSVPVRRTTKYSGAPGLNWNTESAGNIAKAGELAGNALREAGAEIGKFVKAQQDAEDALASREYVAAWNSHQRALSQRMAESPGSVEEFGKWASDAEKDFLKNNKGILERMSKKKRELFELEMNDRRNAAQAKFTKLSTQAKATRIFNGFKNNIEAFCQSGDFEEAYASASQAGSGEFAVFTPEQTDYYVQQYIPQMEEISMLKNSVEAGDFSIVEKLEDPQKYPHLTAAQRKEWIRAAKAKESEYFADENMKLLERLEAGEVITAEQIDAQFAENQSLSGKKQCSLQKQILKKFTEERNKTRTAREKEQRKKEINTDRYNILTFEFSADATERKTQYDKLRNDIITKYPGDGDTVKKLLGQLDDTYNAATKPDSSYKKTFIYQRSRTMLENMQDDFWAAGPEGQTSWFGRADDEELVSSNYRMAVISLDEFLKNNPKATEKDVTTFLDNLKKDVNNTECDKLVDFWASRNRIGKTADTAKEIEREFNGQIAIFDENKKFIRWKDGK